MVKKFARGGDRFRTNTLLSTLSDGSRHEMKTLRYRFTSMEREIAKNEFLSAFENCGVAMDAAAKASLTINIVDAWRADDIDFNNKCQIIENRYSMTQAETQAAFLDHLSRNFNPHKAATMLGVRYKVVQGWLENDPLFKERFDEVIESAVDNVDQALYDMAISGFGRPALSAAAIMLNARRKSLYSFTSEKTSNQPVQFNLVIGSGPNAIQLSGKAPAQLAAPDEKAQDYMDADVLEDSDAS